MKTNFSDMFYRGDDSGSGGGGAGIGSIIHGVTGAAQAIGGAIQQHRYSKKYENLINGYVPNQSIMDYYQKALNKYDPNAYNSASYREGKTNINSNLAAGISSSQDRRGALYGISNLVAGANKASLDNVARAEREQAGNLSQLGGATEMKAREDKYKFENLGGLYSAKATGGANIMNAGLSNIFGAGSSLSQMELLKKMYSK